MIGLSKAAFEHGDFSNYNLKQCFLFDLVGLKDFSYKSVFAIGSGS